MICHGEIYRQRPDNTGLTKFYLIVAFGGVVGSVFASAISPLMFKDYWEFEMAITFVYLLLAWIIFSSDTIPIFLKRYFGSKLQVAFFFVLGWGTLLISSNLIYRPPGVIIDKSRNFYGTLKVIKREDTNNTILYLYNGNIIHGIEVLRGEGMNKPSSYYDNDSGAGVVLKYFPHPQEIAIVGLGNGTLSQYSKDEDHYTFFEINPKVVQAAQNNFTYLKNAKGKIDTVLGDARLSIGQQINRGEKHRYDALILDAFSGDSIPNHLLTQEAFSLYLDILRKNGILLVHITNRYIDLAPVLIKLADHYQLQIRFIETANKSLVTFPSKWALLTVDNNFIEHCSVCFLDNTDQLKSKSTQLWTDDFSNIFASLRW